MSLQKKEELKESIKPQLDKAKIERYVKRMVKFERSKFEKIIEDFQRRLKTIKKQQQLSFGLFAKALQKAPQSFKTKEELKNFFGSVVMIEAIRRANEQGIEPDNKKAINKIYQEVLAGK